MYCPTNISIIWNIQATKYQDGTLYWKVSFPIKIYSLHELTIYRTLLKVRKKVQSMECTHFNRKHGFQLELLYVADMEFDMPNPLTTIIIHSAHNWEKFQSKVWSYLGNWLPLLGHHSHAPTCEIEIIWFQFHLLRHGSDALKVAISFPNNSTLYFEISPNYEHSKLFRVLCVA